MKRTKRLLMILACVLWASVAAAETVLLDFYADACPPCKAMTPVVDQLAFVYRVERIDVEQRQDLCDRYMVTTWPTFVVLADGKEIDRIVGMTTRERLEAHLRPVVDRHVEGKEPTPAWRYVTPVGPLAASVRITCDVGNGTVKGSGTVVKWAGRVVILTAKHVVRDAKSITVRLNTGKTVHCRVVAIDNKWDCAVLEANEPLSLDTPTVQVEVGQSATFHEGDRLDSCGFGPDDRFAVCSTVFVGYRRDNVRSTNDDWMELRGYVRPGDSGGGVFNASGKLVGVIWGGERNQKGEIAIGILAVQTGRIHAILQEALPKLVAERSTPDDGEWRAVIQPGERNPTPPMPCEPGCDSCQAAGGQPQKKYILPGNKALAEIGGIDQRLDSIDAKLNALGNQPPPQQQTPIIIQQPSTPPLPPIASEPAGNKIEQKLDDFLHKVPIQGPITKLEEKQLESEHPLQRFFGATAAIVLITVAVGLVLLGIFLLGHKAYQYLHANLPTELAKLGAIPVVGPKLAAGLSAVDAFNAAKVEPLVSQAQAAIDAKLQAAKADMTAHLQALNTPAPIQSTPAAAPTIILATPAAPAVTK
jgi:thioredoxin 1